MTKLEKAIDWYNFYYKFYSVTGLKKYRTKFRKIKIQILKIKAED